MTEGADRLAVLSVEDVVAVEPGAPVGVAGSGRWAAEGWSRPGWVTAEGRGGRPRASASTPSASARRSLQSAFASRDVPMVSPMAWGGCGGRGRVGRGAAATGRPRGSRVVWTGHGGALVRPGGRGAGEGAPRGAAASGDAAELVSAGGAHDGRVLTAAPRAQHAQAGTVPQGAPLWRRGQRSSAALSASPQSIASPRWPCSTGRGHRQGPPTRSAAPESGCSAGRACRRAPSGCTACRSGSASHSWPGSR